MASSNTQNVIRDDDIDNDVLIEDVEKRPALYDKKLKEYSDINFKIKAWEKISRIIFSNPWSNLSQQEKTEAGNFVQKRCKNLRACFSRELRDQKFTKSGQAATKRRKYNHFDRLLFLVPSMDTRETSGNAEDICCEEDSRDADEDVSQRSQYSRKKKRNTIPYEERLLDILDKKGLTITSLLRL
ncbi:unnamed protein product [Parnassius apollo]|uniref:(apollo) hypothetical protein n=1 Tax=Parnassius apollo TaxID=110799 RepID=A0A8S3XA79_PARAO|nr:unnamed protein product [Parnassius apollo]